MVAYDPEGEPEPKRPPDQNELEERLREELPYLLENAAELCTTLDVVRGELLPWALGLRDPVAERVALWKSSGG